MAISDATSNRPFIFFMLASVVMIAPFSLHQPTEQSPSTSLLCLLTFSALLKSLAGLPTCWLLTFRFHCHLILRHVAASAAGDRGRQLKTVISLAQFS